MDNLIIDAVAAATESPATTNENVESSCAAIIPTEKEVISVNTNDSENIPELTVNKSVSEKLIETDNSPNEVVESKDFACTDSECIESETTIKVSSEHESDEKKPEKIIETLNNDVNNTEVIDSQSDNETTTNAVTKDESTTVLISEDSADETPEFVENTASEENKFVGTAVDVLEDRVDNSTIVSSDDTAVVNPEECAVVVPEDSTTADNLENKLIEEESHDKPVEHTILVDAEDDTEPKLLDDDTEPKLFDHDPEHKLLEDDTEHKLLQDETKQKLLDEVEINNKFVSENIVEESCNDDSETVNTVESFVPNEQQDNVEEFAIEEAEVPTSAEYTAVFNEAVSEIGQSAIEEETAYIHEEQNISSEVITADEEPLQEETVYNETEIIHEEQAETNSEIVLETETIEDENQLIEQQVAYMDMKPGSNVETVVVDNNDTNDNDMKKEVEHERIEFIVEDSQEIAIESEQESNQAAQNKYGLLTPEEELAQVHGDDENSAGLEEVHYTLDDQGTSLTILETQPQIEKRNQESVYIVENFESTSSVKDDSKIIVVTAASKAEPTPEEKPKKPRGRKSFDVPLYVLGRNINNPSAQVSNGRPLPKPRLGVKVPSCNLSSQILTKEEIQKEVMQRVKSKQKQTNSDYVFTQQLTKRLAKKLGATGQPTKEVKHEKAAPSFEDNSDLLAILEGDDVDLKLEMANAKPVGEEQKKEMERAIALQQLEELPNLSPTNRTSSSNRRIETPAKLLTPSLVQRDKRIPTPASPRKIDSLPEVKVNMVLKTYSRKRKSADINEFLGNSNKKVNVTREESKSEISSPTASLPPNTYVTKSSRIIKKKVIWDPDEVNQKSATVTKVTVKQEPSPERKPIVVEKKSVSPMKKVSNLEEKKVVVKKSPIAKSKKRLSEVDRLLMDEGAVNMLYDVKNTEETNEGKKKKSVISIDKAHKELMKKTSEIKNDLQQNTSKDSSISLRKKEGASPTTPVSPAKPMPTTVRKMSKDSTRSSVHTPPASPAAYQETSRIIRRRSSSSFSSGGESDNESNNKTVVPKRKIDSEEQRPKKLRKKIESKTSESDSQSGQKESCESNKVTSPDENVEEKKNNGDSKLNQHESFTMKRDNKLVLIELNYTNDDCYFTIKLLKEVTAILKQLSKDKDCYVVSITSNGKQFCMGLDYSCLVADKEEDRKKKANELSISVREFLKCLLNFPKILVAGIEGNCVGVGVTMLPLFDMVLACDTAVFNTPYARLGCIAEGGFLLTVPYITNHGLAAELLYASQQLKADDAFRRGLVTKLCWPEKYQDELKTILTSISSSSKQSLEAMKNQLRHYDVQSTEVTINSESKVWIDHWISVECQKNFANLKTIITPTSSTTLKNK